ncbi:MAG: N-acyl-D-amino-acid deacylase family protein [Deltaproteobacteria bacterium]
MSAQFDLAILNATLVDGTGAPARVSDIGVKGDRVAFVGDLRGEATRVVDAFGRVLAPGFVDLHGHSDYSLLMDPFARSKVFQGVTTEVGGNCGYHAAPIFGKVADERREEFRVTGGLVCDWESSADYRRRIEEARPSINYAQQIGYNTLRSAVTSDHAKPLSGGELSRLRDLVRAELSAGAVGLSYGLAYVPACFSKTEELVDAATVAAEAGSVLTFHIRDEGHKLLESLEEALLIGRQSGARVHIGHVKTFRKPNWHKIDAALELFQSARREGMDLTVDRYPHLAMNTQLKFILPIWALEGGRAEMTRRLADPETRKRIVLELEGSASGEDAEVLISLVGRPENKRAEGRFLDQISDGGSPWEAACKLLESEGDSAFGTFFGMSRENLDRILQLDFAIVASDASVQAVHKQLGGGRPHPRCFDTFPYFLAEWVFARGVFDLPEAIRKITSLPAHRAGLRDRGVIGEGSFADLVLLDSAALAASVDYEEPIRFPAGIDLVVVNGAVVIDGGRHTGAATGRFLRREE